jgi:hypothetical protein
MRFVDEYRAPEQVMQLIAHLVSGPRCSLIPRSARYGDGSLWRPHPCHL